MFIMNLTDPKGGSMSFFPARYKGAVSRIQKTPLAIVSAPQWIASDDPRLKER